MKSDLVFCVESKLTDKIFPKTGFIPASLLDPYISITSRICKFKLRNKIEEDPDYRQIIPYIILNYKDCFAIYKRTSKGKEERLHQCFSIGFGGHVEFRDAVFSRKLLNVTKTIQRAANRELKEEISHHRIISKTLAGSIHDNSDPVSMVHLGFVEIWTIKDLAILPKSSEISYCKFLKIADLKLLTNQMERWSILCTKYLLS